MAVNLQISHIGFPSYTHIDASIPYTHPRPTTHTHPHKHTHIRRIKQVRVIPLRHVPWHLSLEDDGEGIYNVLLPALPAKNRHDGLATAVGRLVAARRLQDFLQAPFRPGRNKFDRLLSDGEALVSPVPWQIVRQGSYATRCCSRNVAV